MKARIITEADYAILNNWCKTWNFPEIAQKDNNILPKYGLIISDKSGEDIIGGFLYLTDSVFAHPEWIVTNKSYKNKVDRKLAFKMLFDEFGIYAKTRGHSLFLMSVKDNFLIHTLQMCGFVKTDSIMTNLIKEI